MCRRRCSACSSFSQLFHLRHDYTEAATIKGEFEGAIAQLRTEHDAPAGAGGKDGDASEQALKKAKKSAVKDLEKARAKREKKVRPASVLPD